MLNLIIYATDAIGERKGRILFVYLKLKQSMARKPLSKYLTPMGISETDLIKIFTAFYTTKKTGIGLGLAAVKRIAAAHRVYCDVKSVTGRGSTFTIRLPIDL